LQGFCVKFNRAGNVFYVAGSSRLGRDFVETRRSILGGEIAEWNEKNKQEEIRRSQGSALGQMPGLFHHDKEAAILACESIVL